MRSRVDSKTNGIDITMGVSDASDHIALSGLADSERRGDLKKLVSNLQWTGSLVDLVRASLNSKDSKSIPNNPVVLGLSANTKAAVDTVAELLNGQHWKNAYDQFGISGRSGSEEDTLKLLNSIVDSNRDIVMLVPQNMFSHPQASVTKREMQWFLDNPKKAKRLWLIYGSYDIFNETEFLKLKKQIHEQTNDFVCQAPLL